MTAPRVAWWIFLAGLVPLAFATQSLRAFLGDWLSFGLAIIYLILLRVGGELLERKLRARKEAEHET